MGFMLKLNIDFRLRCEFNILALLYRDVNEINSSVRGSETYEIYLAIA
jgi:hypothetical protein